MTIIWSQTALDTYLQIIDYLFEEWTEREINKFQNTVANLLHRISTHNHICPVSQLLNYHKCLVMKQNSLIYTIQNNSIILVTFIDNRAMHPF